MVHTTPQPHLAPYLEAVARHGGGFRSLLWASPKTQRRRFAAITSAVNLHGRIILDAGCGRADLLGYLLKHDVRPAEYIGLEAVDELADAAERCRHPNARIVRGDFVREPLRLCVGAQAIIFSGSLNTLADPEFYQTLRNAFIATGQDLVFNFLSSSALAGKLYLFWRSTEDVERFGRTLTSRVETYEDYIDGDCTIVLRKER